MRRTLVVTRRAQGHIRAAAQWHQAQESGLGVRFLEALDHRLIGIEQFPEAWPIVCRSFRRALLRPFNYGVFYRVDTDTVIVVGVLDLRQDPQRLHHRLES